MADFSCAINLIRKYEGFNEKAYPDPFSGGEPYTIGYGTQFYPDGSPVKRGQCCTKEKALEYLFHEVQIIDSQLQKLNMGLDSSMNQALISFIHSIGWEPFLYSGIIDAIDREDWAAAAQEIHCWVFNEERQVVGGLLDRRRDESNLFLLELNNSPWVSTEILLAAFRNYSAASHQVRAIRMLEEKINPYVLSEFANNFQIENSAWIEYPLEDLDALFNV